MDIQDKYTNGSMEERAEQEDLKFLLFKYLRYWKWFVLSVILALLIAFFYNRYASVIYSTSGSIKILKDKETGMDLSGLEGGGLFNFREVNLENEMEILKSRRILDSVVHRLNLHTVYYKSGNIKKNEVWGRELPFIIEWDRVDTTLTKDLPTFVVNFKSRTQFEIYEEDGGIINGDGSSQTTGFNNKLEFEAYHFQLMPNPKYRSPESYEGESFSFQPVTESAAINGLLKNLSIEPVGKQSEILRISYQGSNRGKNEAIVNTLIKEFNQDGIRDKQLVSQRTEEFVAERAKLLFKELDTVETGLVSFKQEGGIVTIESTAGQLFGKESESAKKRYEMETQLELVKAFKQELERGDAYGLLPANLGIESSTINELTERYNENVFLRRERLVSSTPENPAVIHLEDRLDEIKDNILSSISSYIIDLGKTLDGIESRERESSSRLHGLPQQEKGIRSITRQQEVKERLYLFLLQKREEATLEYAITSPVIKLVDAAYTNPIAVAPKSKIIYLAALILGGLIPFGFFYLKFLLNSKVEDRDDIQRALPNTPIVAEIPLLSKKEANLVVQNDHSILAESFRMLRTNLTFMNPISPDKTEEGQVIMVTSSIKGEGKTFTALNLAHTLSATGKKILVIGADLRNPQTHTYYNFDKNEAGLTNYLVDPSITYKDILKTGDRYFSNMDLIIAGPIPPNPAELLISGRFEQILKEVKQDYDYVIVDTAPTVLVSDTLLISEVADITIYMVKTEHTDKRLLEHIKELAQTKKLHNIGIVLNGVTSKSGYGYNYGYGYGYFEDKLAASWKFWK